jgi:hypothetical protein
VLRRERRPNLRTWCARARGPCYPSDLRVSVYRRAGRARAVDEARFTGAPGSLSRMRREVTPPLRRVLPSRSRMPPGPRRQAES